MAVGFTPKHTEEIALGELSPQHFLALATEIIERLGWKLSYLSETGIIAYTANGVFSFNAKVTIKIADRLASVESASVGTEMVDLNKNKKTALKFTAEYEEYKSQYTATELDTKYEAIKGSVLTGEDDILTQPPPTAAQNLRDFFSLFVPKEGFYMTPILMDINIVVFILMCISGVNIFQPDSQSLLTWGANFRPVTLAGEWWRLITCCFLHIGIIHLLFNMYALLYIGVLLEPILGKTRYLSAYLLTGLASSATSLWWHDNIISAGASGAIFGMYGLFLALLTTNFIEKQARVALLSSIGVFVGYNLLNGMKGGIDNAAHMGGLVSGAIVGYAYIPSLKRNEDEGLQLKIIAGLAVLIIAASGMVFKSIPNDLGEYDAKMKKFELNEHRALGVLDSANVLPKQRVLYELRYQGLNLWQDNLKIITDAEKLQLPAEIKERDKKLLAYCELRIKAYNTIYKAVDEGTRKYDDEISGYHKQIQAIIAEFKVMNKKDGGE